MAIEDFWYNVRRAAGGVFLTNVYFADEPQPTPAEVEVRLRADTGIWFRASTVAGYRKVEGTIGSFLSPEEQRSLPGAVTAFEVAVADKILDAGVKAFAHILEVMNFYRYGDPEGFRWGKQIEHRLREGGLWPKSLHELRFWRATQHDDFLVLSIYAYLKEAVVKTIAGYLDECWVLRPVLNAVADEIAPDWFAHITFRTDETLAEYANQPDEDDDAVPATGTTPAAGGL